METTPKTLFNALEKFGKTKVLVLGDVMLDHYVYGDVLRISPEAPVPVLRKTGEDFNPAGAANVAYNLAALGATVNLAGVVGKDREAEKLFSLLDEVGIKSNLILVDPSRVTTLKNRYVAQNHQLLRVDHEASDHLSSTQENNLLIALEPEIAKVDVVVFSDYDKGFFSEEFTKRLIGLCKQLKKKIIADIKPVNKSYFVGVDVIAPNRQEAEEMTGVAEIEKAGQNLVSYFNSDVLITKSEEGVSVFKKDGSRKDFPTKKIKIFDVSGAGDTVMAVVALSLGNGLDLNDAAFLANYAGGIVVQKPGAATLTNEELSSALSDEKHIESVDIVPKLWGYEKWIENNEKYCSKILSVNAGYQCSLHYHKIKDEMFLITSGSIRLELGDEILYLRAGNFVRIPPGVPHRFRGIEDSEMLEISSHHMEEDSYRLEKSKKVEKGDK